MFANALLAGNAPRGGSDPAINLTARDSSFQQAGKLTGLTVTTLGGYLNDYHNGIFKDIALAWEVMERRDDAVAPARRKRWRKFLCELRSWRIATDEDSPAAERQAEYLRNFYHRITAQSAITPHVRGGLHALARYAVDAIGKQYSLLGKFWTGAGESLSLNCCHVPLWFFKYDKGVFAMRQNRDTGDYTAIDPARWIIAAQPEAVMEAVCVLVMFKRLPMHQLVHVLEKWGVPGVYGHTNAAKDSPEWQAMLTALQNVISGWTGVLSGDAEIKSIESQFRSANLHKPWIERCDECTYINWLGSHLGTSAKSGTGTLAGGSQADDTDDIIREDCIWFSDLMHEQVDKDALLYGLGIAPENILARFEVLKPDDTDDKGDMDLIERAVKLGAEIPVDHVHDRFALPRAEAGQEILQVAQAPSPFGAPPPDADNAAGTSATLSPATSSPATKKLATISLATLALMNAATASIGTDLDMLGDNSLHSIGSAYADMLQPLLNEIAAAPNLVGAELLTDAYKIPDDRRNAFGEAMGRTMFAAVMRGYEPIRPEIPAANSAPRGLAGWFKNTFGARNAAGLAQYAPLPFDEAREFWANKKLVASFDDIAGSTWQEARVFGFKIAGITEHSALRAIHADIDSAIRGQRTVRDLAGSLVEKYGRNAVHAETIVRTNIQSAYNWGHYQQLTDPAVLEAFPIWGFDVVMDDDTSAICRPLAGKAYPANHNIFDSAYPPNHYRCRTRVYPLGADEAAAHGFTLEDKWPIDPKTGKTFAPLHGFEMNVGKVENAGKLICPRTVVIPIDSVDMAEKKARPARAGDAKRGGIPVASAYRRDIVREHVALDKETGIPRVDKKGNPVIGKREYRWTKAGQEIVDAAEIERLNAFKIRPDLREVLLAGNATDTKAMQLATGFDAKGKAQPIYSSAHIEKKKLVKWTRTRGLTREIDTMRATIASDMRAGKPVAFVARMEDVTCIRKGNPRDIRADKKAYGITTLEGRHINVSGDAVTLNFSGKKGVPYERTFHDKPLADFLAERKRVTADAAKLFPDVQGGKLNAYIHDIAEGDYWVHDFRHMHGTRKARAVLEKYEGRVLTKKEKSAVVKAACEDAAALLNNTPAAAKAAYIDPAVWELIGGLD